jgi:hypothetical protein
MLLDFISLVFIAMSVGAIVVFLEIRYGTRVERNDNPAAQMSREDKIEAVAWIAFLTLQALCTIEIHISDAANIYLPFALLNLTMVVCVVFMFRRLFRWMRRQKKNSIR